MNGPIDGGELKRTVQAASEAAYKRSYQLISDLQRRVRDIERSESAYLVTVQDATQLPPIHYGGLAFVTEEAKWYYCDGTQWLAVPVGEPGGGGGGDPAIHVLATSTGLGSYHTMSGAQVGDVLRATGAVTARFEALAHDDLVGITPDQHHAKLHLITDNNNHTIEADPWGVVGAVNTNTLGILSARSDATYDPKEVLLKSDPNGDLWLHRLYADDAVFTPRVESDVGDLNLVANADVIVTPGHWTMFADNKDMRSWSHTPGFLGQGWKISWPEVDRPHLDIRSIYAEQLEVSAFQADIMRVRIAEDFLTQGMAFTAEDFITPGGTVDPNNTVRVMFESNPVLGEAELFLPDEWVMFNIIQRGVGLVVAQIWGQVSLGQIEAPDEFGVGRQSWLFTLRNGNTNFTIPKSSIALAFGTSSAKNGYIHHNVLSTANGPWTRYATWTGDNPYTVANRKYHVQIGNLHGLVDIDSDRYGIAAGDNLAKTPNDPTEPFRGFTADNTAGMRLFNTDISAYVGDVQKMYIAATGQEMWLGTSPSDKRFSYLDGDLTVVGVLEAAGHQFRADEDGVKISVSPGARFEGLSESVQWLYNSLDTDLRTWIGTRVFGSGDTDSQLALAAHGGAPGAWGSIAFRAREGGQSMLMDDVGTSVFVTPVSMFIGTQSGLRISSNPDDLTTPVPGGQLYVETIVTEDLTVTGSISGDALSGAAWEFPGDMLINAHASTDTVVTIANLSAGRADLSVDRDIIVGGNVDGVDVSALSTAYTSHIGNVDAHHAQAHAYDSADHTGTLSWAKVDKTGASLADLPTRNYLDLNSRGHAIVGADHTVTGAQYQLVGIPTTPNVLGLLTPSASPAANTIAMTDATSRLTLVNLTTTNAILANGGVDYGADTLIEDGTYLQLAGSKPLNTAVTLRADYWSLTPAGLLTVPNITAPGELIIGPADSVIFAPGDNHVYTAEGVWLTSADYASETTGWGLSPTGVADVRALLANEIIAKSFIVDLEQALAGGEIVTKSVTKLSLDYAVPHATTTPIVFRAKATASTLTATLTITKPAGTAQHDFMLAHIITSSTVSISARPANWFPLATVNSGGGKLHLFIYTATASEGASYAWTLSAASEAIGTIQAFSGVDIGDPVITYTTQHGSGTNIIVPGISTQINGVGMAFVAGLYDTSNAGLSAMPPSGYTERDDTLGPAHTWLTAASTVQAGLGLASDPLSAMSVSHAWAGALFALKPATYNTTRFTVDDLPSATGMAVFESGDIVRLRQFSRAGGGLTITDCWGVVTGFTNNGNGTQSWNFARSAAPNAGLMSAGSTVAAGALVLDYGKDGDGFYEINAYSGTYASTAPYAQVVKWTGHPATGQVVRTREGNLEGITQQVDEYGLWAGAKGAGSLGAADQYIRVSNMGVLINNVPLKLYNGSGVQTIQLNSDGTAWFKDGAGNVKFNWDGTNLTVVGSITVTGGNAATTGDLAGKINVGGAAGDINTNITLINGGKITTGSIDGDRINLLSYLAIGPAGAWQSDGAQIQYNAGNPRAYIGSGGVSAGSRYFMFDGTTISWRAANTTLDTSGNLTATNVNLTGVITATSGTFSGIVYASGGSFTGAITATSGSFTGTITSSSGTIGGWTISATALTSNSGTVGINTSDSNSAFYAGSATPFSAPFRVSANGVLTATGAVISGNVSITNALTINSATWMGVGLQAEYHGGAPRFYVGNGAAYTPGTSSSARFIMFDGTNATIAGQMDIYGNSNIYGILSTTGSIYAGNGRVRMSTDGIRLVYEDFAAADPSAASIPASSSAMRWFPTLTGAYNAGTNYCGMISYRFSQTVVPNSHFFDMTFASVVGNVDWIAFDARINFQAGHYDAGGVYTACNFEIIRQASLGQRQIWTDAESFYIVGNLSAQNVQDRTPHYDGDAVGELKKVKANKQGGIDHKSLPAAARRETENPKTKEIEETRDLGMMISILTVAVQQLDARLDKLEKRLV